MTPSRAIVAALVVLAVNLDAQSPTLDPTMTRPERAELIDLLNKSNREFLEAVETVTDRQWSFRPGPDRWSIAEVAEHIVLSEAALFDNATKNVNGSADEKWDATLGKTDLLRRALPNRSTKVTAPEEIQPKRGMTRAQLMAHFKAQRARTLAYAQETEAPLKAHTVANPFFGPLNGHQWLLYIPLHNLRHNLQIAEVKTASDYPR
jgi:DinB family protein